MPEQVFLLCRTQMDQICKTEPEGGWLSYIFRRLLADCFPENYTVQEVPGAERAADHYLKVLNGLLKWEREKLPFDPCRDFILLKKEEEQYCSILSEYRRFLDCFYADAPEAGRGKPQAGRSGQDVRHDDDQG